MSVATLVECGDRMRRHFSIRPAVVGTGQRRRCRFHTSSSTIPQFMSGVPTLAGRFLSGFGRNEAYLKRGRLEEGFLRVRCETRRAETLVAFSHRRGFGPSCDARSQT